LAILTGSSSIVGVSSTSVATGIVSEAHGGTSATIGVKAQSVGTGTSRLTASSATTGVIGSSLASGVSRLTANGTLSGVSSTVSATGNKTDFRTGVSTLNGVRPTSVATGISNFTGVGSLTNVRPTATGIGTAAHSGIGQWTTAIGQCTSTGNSTKPAESILAGVQSSSVGIATCLNTHVANSNIVGVSCTVNNGYGQLGEIIFPTEDVTVMAPTMSVDVEQGNEFMAVLQLGKLTVTIGGQEV
jgi:hypothetical protein